MDSRLLTASWTQKPRTRVQNRNDIPSSAYGVLQRYGVDRLEGGAEGAREEQLSSCRHYCSDGGVGNASHAADRDHCREALERKW